MTSYSKRVEHGEDAEVVKALGLGVGQRRATHYRAPEPIRATAPDLLAAQCKMGGLPEPQRELRFHDTRRWRFDLAWPVLRIAVEVDGGIWNYGRHNRASGWLADQEKLNEAAILGWRILHVTPAQVNSGEALNLIERIVKGER